MEENSYTTTIRDYAEGTLTGDALRDFTQRLQTDPNLQAELDLYLALKAMDNQRLKKQLLQVAEAEQLTPLTPSQATLLRQLPRWLAVAASLVLVLAALWWWRQPSAKDDPALLAQNYLATPYPPPVATMGEADTRPVALQNAFLAYRTGNFAAAAQQLAPLSVPAETTDEILFYTGESLLQTGQLEAALAAFGRVRPGYWREAADWRSALALLKSGQTARAKPLLEKLRNTGRRAQVEGLLKAME